MSSTVLLQARGEEAQVRATPKLVLVESLVGRIRITAGEAARSPTEEGKFSFNAEMVETGRAQDTLRVKYALEFGRVGSSQACRLSGEAVFRLSHLVPEADLGALGEEFGNDMAVEIFRHEYESLYLVHMTMGLEAPSPWITQEVSLSKRIQFE